MTPSESGRTWRALLDLLGEADRTFLDGPRAVEDTIGVTAGYRHLTHLLSCAFDLYLEADAERPVFTPLASATRKASHPRFAPPAPEGALANTPVLIRGPRRA